MHLTSKQTSATAENTEELRLVRPFAAYRYTSALADKLSQIICPPYDVIDRRLQVELLYNRYNFIRIILSPFGHSHAAETLRRFIKNGTIVREEKEKIYILRQRFKIGNVEKQAVGVISLVSRDAKTFPHERANSKVIEDRMELLEKTGFNTCPIMLFAKNTNMKKMLKEIPKEKLFEFSYPAHEFGVKVHGELFSSDDFSVLRELERTCFFIADGHHRFKAVNAVYNLKKEKYYMAYITDDNSGTQIFPIARVLRSDLTPVVRKLSQNFEPLKIKDPENLQEWLEALSSPETDCILLTKTGAFKVSFQKNPEESTMNFIHSYIIKDVEFSFQHSLAKIIEDMRRGKVICSIVPRVPSVGEIWETVERGEILPPKSTYFWPKIPSGLVMNRTGFSEI